MKVTITDFIDNDHRSHYWYGGECAQIEHNGYTALIEAIGDVYAEYIPNGEYVTHVKDKNNTGFFYTEMNYYLENDENLYKAINNGDLTFDYNNWWECSIIDPQGNWHDLMWVLDDDYLNEAIETVKASLNDVIRGIEEDEYVPSAERRT